MDSVEELLKKAKTLSENEKYQELCDLLPDDLLEKYKNADLYAEKAQAFYNLNKIDLCANAVEKALTIDPKNENANFTKANVYFARKQYDNAAAGFISTIEIAPANSVSYYNLGLCYYYLKNYDQSITTFLKCLELNPKYTDAYDTLGDAYRETKQYDQAIAAHKKAIQLDPHSESAYIGLGIAYSESNQSEKAITAYNEAIKINPRSEYPYNNLGLTYNDLKENTKSIEFFNKSIEANPKYADPFYNRARTFFNIEQYEKALTDYKTYYELTRSEPDYYTSIAKERISEIDKLITDKEYTAISELVNKIKKNLLFNDPCITHYTGLSTAKALVLDNSLLRLSEGAYLNDTSEGRELFNYLPFKIGPRQSNDTIAEPFAKKPFIGSFVAESKHDDLTLWRMYGKEAKDEAKGCAITILKEKFIEKLKEKLVIPKGAPASIKTDNEFSFYRVAYRTQNPKKEFAIPSAEAEETVLNEFMKDLAEKVKAYKSKRSKKTDDLQKLLELLNEIAYLFKSAEYQYENEIRLVIKGIGFEKVVDHKFTPPRVYIELIEISPAIKQITLGPKVERSDEWASAFYYKLDKDDHHPDILISHLPFK